MTSSASGVDNWGEIYQMDLDGSSPTKIYETGRLQTPWFQYGVKCMRYSHKDKALYFLCFNIESGAAVDKFLYDGLFVMKDKEIADGVSAGAARYIKSMNQIDLLSDANPPSIPAFELGCGFETFGKSTKR